VTTPRSRRAGTDGTLIQDEFRDLVAAADGACAARFGSRLRGAYLAGSTAFGEAWPGASDLDWFVYLQDEPTRADKTWQRRTRRRLESRFPVASEVHLNLFSLDRLRRDAFERFIIRYNTVRVRGTHLIAGLAREGIRTPRPSRRLAKGRLGFVRQCWEATLAGRCPPSLQEPLPSDPFLRTRKLARNYVIVEGAFALMTVGTFESFRQEAVLRGLREASTRWRPLVKTTEAVLADPFRAAVPPEAFVRDLRPFMEWVIDRVDNALPTTHR
jgi:predicted nucleotidyltransferase